MYKIITHTGKRMLVDYFETLEKANELYEHLVQKVKKFEFLLVVLAYVPKNPKELEIIKHCYR